MASIGNVTHVSVAVLLLALIPISLADTAVPPTPPISYLMNTTSNMTGLSWMNTIMKNNSNSAYQCLYEIQTDLRRKIEPLTSANRTGENIRTLIRDIAKNICRDHVMQFLTCLETKVSLGTTEMDNTLKTLIDFPRLRALMQYLCGKIDAIVDNFDCLQSTFRTIMTKMRNPNDTFSRCYITSITPVMGLVNTTEYNEENGREVLGALVNAGACLKPLMKGCGDLVTIYEHTLGEMNSMYKGEKYANSAIPVTGHSSLLVTVVVALAVVLRIGYW